MENEKYALITGSTKGIGRAIAIRLASEGYNVAVCARNYQELVEFKAVLQTYGKRVEVFEMDATLPGAATALCDAVSAAYPRLDVLVNNLGIFVPGSLLDEQESVLDLQLQVNVKPAYAISRYFGREMRKSGSGHIINICSVASKSPAENAGSYSVTKAALLSLNDVLRQELAAHRVKVTAILPGSTLTSSWDGTTLPDDAFVQPEDIAETIVSVLRLSAGANVDEIVIRPLKS